jgi:CRISPR-associated exonuclease Cas4
MERGRQVLRGVELWSERYGLTGRADVIEVQADGSVEPVEYKHGLRHGRNAEIQVCAQAICLEEMLRITVQTGCVWYSGLRRRQRIELDDDLRGLTHRTIIAVRSAFTADHLPRAVNDQRCVECQLRQYCLPELVVDPARIARYVEREVLACA